MMAEPESHKTSATGICQSKTCFSCGSFTYFDELEKIVHKYNMESSPQLIYNVDEKGFMPNHKPPRVVATNDLHPQAVTSGKSHVTTVIGAGSASGVAVPPFFVFAGARMMPDLLKDGTPGTDGAMSETGWSNTDVFRHYLQQHFIKYLPNREPGQHILLLLDGHASHVAVDLVEWAKSHNIILFVLSARTSHILQPLDVSCYGPLQKIYDNICHKFTRETSSHITRYDICGLACKAYSKALKPENLFSAFKKTGIYPLDRTVIKPESLTPATVFQSTSSNTVNEEPTKETNVNETEMQTVADDVEQMTNNTGSPSNILNEKLNKIITVKAENVKKRKPRKTVSKILSGKAVTEDDTMAKLVEFQTRSTSKTSKCKSNKRKSSTTGKGKQTKKICQKNLKKSNEQIDTSPKPGPSSIYISDSSQSLSDDDIDDSEKCCACNLFTPKEIRQSNYLQFTQWVQCDSCPHWVHLKFCTKIRVVRRGEKFYCNHCVQPSEE